MGSTSMYLKNFSQQACVREDEGEEGPVGGAMKGRRGLCAGG